MNNLKILRKAKGLTQKEVADFIGISQNNYSYWENGKVKIDNGSLQKLADFFDVTVDYLLGREEKSSPAQQESGGIVIPEKYKDVAVAFHGGADNLTQADIDDIVCLQLLDDLLHIVRFIEFTKSKKNQ